MLRSLLLITGETSVSSFSSDNAVGRVFESESDSVYAGVLVTFIDTMVD